MVDEIPNDASLLRCTYAKSKHTTLKLLIYGVGITGVVITSIITNYLFYTISTICSNLTSIWLTELKSGLIYICSHVFEILILVPWWIDLFIIAIIAIILYSFLWCLNRDITEDDRNHEGYTKTHQTINAIVMLPFGVYGGVKGFWIGYDWGIQPMIYQYGTLVSSQANAVMMGCLIFIILGFVGAGAGLIIGESIGDCLCTLHHYFARKQNITAVDPV